MKRVGLTTTVPVEILLAAGVRPVDLNNIFVTSGKALDLIEAAEIDGFPRNICAWIKGLYATAIAEEIDTIIGVTEGDCSNTKSLIEVWQSKGIDVISFGFPQKRQYEEMLQAVDGLMRHFQVNIEAVEEIKRKLYPIRQRVKYLDELTWKYNKATGFENHLWQVSCSDFNGDPQQFLVDLEKVIGSIEKRTPFEDKEVRLGYIGVPPIVEDLYTLIENNQGRVVYNEVQKAFTMAENNVDVDIHQMYLNFTYPYDLQTRLRDIKTAIIERKLDGMIHYTQSFCHRGIEDIVIKKELDLPILTIEGDLPGKADARTKLRIESFLDMLKDLKE
ncbi:benzoyl-CoA reductase/2-hydroxyglutaryl-CoA dehydratase subunit, BcrC/BadD/HgdB [Clostridium aceticum]|uniref:Benzoyl-CoA reductase/2-hydroxyglutaryl-CoA dehydratase subunit, BcrC/BadD/HgdB n=1 Tax=Clostridium aceticum TaxID=84022 RepID=A0A0D8IA91_9CLOT|nr:2-hydroxyacyl-CoA dehydratase [Clostridium aceticum]AKL96370.1 benzoyl-CoA reductase/2-hydroxyglutaryl-CoA dehydratase subunit, BcrC/BadD/HgdB [Clostridium aceticum]KJF26954.1 2-hydroxyglutaryl-CoA dehydratase [Clostridium aceticum]